MYLSERQAEGYFLLIHRNYGYTHSSAQEKLEKERYSQSYPHYPQLSNEFPWKNSTEKNEKRRWILWRRRGL